MEPFLGPVVQASDRRLANSYRFPSGARTWIHSQRLSRPQPRTRGALNGHSGRPYTCSPKNSSYGCPGAKTWTSSPSEVVDVPHFHASPV